MSTYDLAKSLFLQALDVPAEARPAFLAEECHGDEGLRAEVESLLAFHDRALSDLDGPRAETLPERIADYRVLRELGRGGMGLVLLAQRGDEPPVALKLLRPGLVTPELLQRFGREAAMLARLDHPGIARLLRTGVAELPGGAQPWLAMSLVEGSDLRAWARGERTPAERLELMARVCDAVQHAHEHGVVHRDLKPENILVREDGHPVVLDFGVARLADGDLNAASVLTTIGLLVGTIRYMSPEQAEAAPGGIDARSDVYALGVLAYELLTGRLPYDVPENSVHRALVAVMTAPTRPMQELPAPLRAPLERVLRAALAKVPAQRTASAAELAADLRRVAAGRRPHARRVTERGERRATSVRSWVSLGSLAALAGILLSTWRMTPSPADWAQGVLQPRRMCLRVLLAIDSASVRLHYTTRTLEREREALAWTLRARALVRTVGWRPWSNRVERMALFREGEARYLIAERTNDVAQYEAASKLWYMSRERHYPADRTVVPDTTTLTAADMGDDSSPAPWLSASMALADAARLSMPAEHFTRAVELAREGEVARAARLRTEPPQDSLSARFRANERTYVLARLGAALVGQGVHAIQPDTLAKGIADLREAVERAAEAQDAPGFASHLHELGVGEARAAQLRDDPAALDSALVHLRRAFEIRSGLEGYTSRWLSRLELGQALRLAARFHLDPAVRARDLREAAALLALTPGERASLGALDRAFYDIAGAALRVDEACLARDTTGLAAPELALEAVVVGARSMRAPTVQIAGLGELGRLAAVRFAASGDGRFERRAQQAFDLATLQERNSPSARDDLRLHEAKVALRGAPRAFELDWPIPEPN